MFGKGRCEKFDLCNIYAPSEDNPQFFTKVLKMIDEFDSPSKILAGDLNFCFNLDLDKRGTMYNNSRSQVAFLEFMEEQYLADVWRIKNPGKFNFTWKRNRPTRVMSRLDYFIISNNLVSWNDEAYIRPGFRCGLSFLGLVLSPTNIERGRGYWIRNIPRLFKRN